MPPRTQPQFYQLLVKTHKLTIFLTASQSSTIASLKEDALSALQSDVNRVEDVPKVSGVDGFEICRGVKDKNRNLINYEVLDGSQTVKSILVNWEVLFLQFKDDAGNLLPVEVTQPSLLEEDDEDPRSQVQVAGLSSSSAIDPTSPASNKGKRKAPPE